MGYATTICQHILLHGGILHEEVYMTPPTRLHPQHPHYVCKLHKALYGLKLAPLARFTRFSLRTFFQAPFERASVKVAKSLTRIRGSARLLEGIDPTPGSIRC